MAPSWCDLGIMLVSFCIMLVSFLYHLGIRLVSFWYDVGIRWVAFLYYFGMIWATGLVSFWYHFGVRLGIILVSFPPKIRPSTAAKNTEHPTHHSRGPRNRTAPESTKICDPGYYLSTCSEVFEQTTRNANKKEWWYLARFIERFLFPYKKAFIHVSWLLISQPLGRRTLLRAAGPKKKKKTPPVALINESTWLPRATPTPRGKSGRRVEPNKKRNWEMGMWS